MKKTIVCFGDSNTHGYQSANNGRFSEEERWTCLLERFLGDEYHVLEEGLSGRTCVFDDPLFEGLNGLSSIFPCLMTHEPVDLLILMLGTNDIKERFSCNAENIAKGMERLVCKAKSVTDAWREAPCILIVAPAPVDERYIDTFVANEMGRGCAEKSRELAFYYHDVAKHQNCHFLDAGTLGLTMHPNDYMHLDKESHQKLAAALSEFIPKLLNTE